MTIRDSIEAAVTAEPVDGTVLLQRVRAAEQGRERSRHARRWVAAATAVAAAGAVGLVVVLPGASIPGAREQVLAPGEDELPPPAEVREQAVTWHGVQVRVPSDWKLGDQHCGVAQSDTVLVPGAINLCLPPYVPGLTVVEFRAGADDPPPDARPFAVSGEQGSRYSEPLTEEQGVLATLTLPTQNVTVTVRSPDPAAAEAILDTATIVEADALGCPARLPDTKPPVPDVPGAADRVLPGRPESVVVCEYGDLRIERGGRLPADRIAEVQRVLDAAPTGPSPSQVGVTVVAEACPELDRAPTVLLATYADSRTLQIFTRLNSCTGPDPDNGARQVRVDQSFIGDLIVDAREHR